MAAYLYGNISIHDIAALKAFYYSTEYAQLIAIRQRAATGSIVLIEGYLP